MPEKLYSYEERDFAIDWADRWFQLNQLLWDLFKFDETPSPPPPTEVEELNYQSLRRWFIDHESQFISLWRGFWECRNLTACSGDEATADILDVDQFIETLSSSCYGPENLYRLIYGLGIQSEVDRWLPNEKRAWKKMAELLQISCLVIEFVYWIREETEGSALRDQ